MKILRILEISWLVFGLSGLGLSVYSFLNEGAGAAILPLGFALIACIFYWVRRKQRLSFERQREQE